MLSALACVPMLQLAYSFPPDRKLVYDLFVELDGYLPVLGGETASASIRMALEVGGLPPDAEGHPRAYSDLREIKISFNGAELPFGLENVKAYFPKTTISHTRAGRVLKTDAPDAQLPVRLPGLDVKRFPEISYLPVELPEGSVEMGKSWAFKRAFSGADLHYSVTPRSLSERAAELDIRVEQRFDSWETESGEIAPDEKTAARKVSTELAGSGTAVFAPDRGVATKVAMKTVATSKVEDLKTGAKSERVLRTELKVQLREPGVAPLGPPVSRPSARFLLGWRVPDVAAAWLDSAEIAWKVFLGVFGLPKRAA